MREKARKTNKEVREDHSFWGRLVESTVGAHLLNSIRGTRIELFYWREGDKETVVTPQMRFLKRAKK
jgi:hypothetical protein